MQLTSDDRIVAIHVREYVSGRVLRQVARQALAIAWRTDLGETGGTAEYYGDGVPCPWVDGGMIAVSIDAPGWRYAGAGPDGAGRMRRESSPERTLRLLRETFDGAQLAGADVDQEVPKRA